MGGFRLGSRTKETPKFEGSFWLSKKTGPKEFTSLLGPRYEKIKWGWNICKVLWLGTKVWVWSFFQLSIISLATHHMLEPILNIGWNFWDLLFPTPKLWENFRIYNRVCTRIPLCWTSDQPFEGWPGPCILVGQYRKPIFNNPTTALCVLKHQEHLGDFYIEMKRKWFESRKLKDLMDLKYVEIGVIFA